MGAKRGQAPMALFSSPTSPPSTHIGNKRRVDTWDKCIWVLRPLMCRLDRGQGQLLTWQADRRTPWTAEGSEKGGGGGQSVRMCCHLSNISAHTAYAQYLFALLAKSSNWIYRNLNTLTCLHWHFSKIFTLSSKTFNGNLANSNSLHTLLFSIYFKSSPQSVVSLVWTVN